MNLDASAIRLWKFEHENKQKLNRCRSARICNNMRSITAVRSIYITNNTFSHYFTTQQRMFATRRMLKLRLRRKSLNNTAKQSSVNYKDDEDDEDDEDIREIEPTPSLRERRRLNPKKVQSFSQTGTQFDNFLRKFAEISRNF